MKRHGETLNAHCYVTEAGLKRLPIIPFQFYDIWQRQKRKETVKRSLLAGGGEGREDEKKEQIIYLVRQRVPQDQFPLLSS